MEPGPGPAVGRRRRARRCLLAAALATLLAPSLAAAADDAAAWTALQRDGAIVLFRHANAPGIGDPPGFRLGDCSSQRNLDDTGRAQARRIGERLRERGVPVRAVLSSRWCRARETAELAFPGLAAREETVFDSFFGERQDEPAKTAAARKLLAQWKGPGVLVVTTHQVNITALTGLGPGSGEGVVVSAAGDRIEVMGRIAP